MTSKARVTAIPMSKPHRIDPATSTYVQPASISLSPRQNTWSRHGGRPDWVSGAGSWSHPGAWQWSGEQTTLLTQTTTVTNTLQPSTGEGSQSPSSPPSTKKGGVSIDVATAAGIGVGVSIALLIVVAIAYFCWARSKRRKRQQNSSSEQDSATVEKSNNNNNDNDNNDNTLWPTYPGFASNNESPIELPAALSPREMPAENKPQEMDASDDRGGLRSGDNGRRLGRQASKASMDFGVMTVSTTVTRDK